MTKKKEEQQAALRAWKTAKRAEAEEEAAEAAKRVERGRLYFEERDRQLQIP